MNEQQSPATPLSDQALKRLRGFAEGNGLKPEEILLLKADERIYIMGATIALRPLCETKSERHPGRTAGKDRKIFPTFMALHEEAARQSTELKGNPGLWLDDAKAELMALPGHGFGVDEAKIIIPKHSLKLTATEPCPSCHGQKFLGCENCHAQGFVMCVPCQGRGKEPCYMCLGQGQIASQPGQPCPTCRGTRLAPCRWCVKMNHPPGQVPCPQCLGRRTLPCQACHAQGSFTEDIDVDCSAETQFRLLTAGFPSGFNRALDRIGINNLAKTYADIEVYTPTEEEALAISENKRMNDLPPAIYYRAKIPYSELRIKIRGQFSNVQVFGKRCILMGVPTFLDDALASSRDTLADAVKGRNSLENAMTTRTIRDAVFLQVGGKGTVKELRRLYPYVLSADVAQEIIQNAGLALDRATRVTRGIVVSVILVLVGMVLSYALLTPFHSQWVKGWSTKATMGFDLALPLGSALGGWLMLALATRLSLAMRFKGQKVALIPRTGLAGIVLFAGIALMFVGILSRTKPLWLLALWH